MADPNRPKEVKRELAPANLTLPAPASIPEIHQAAHAVEGRPNQIRSFAPRSTPTGPRHNTHSGLGHREGTPNQSGSLSRALPHYPPDGMHASEASSNGSIQRQGHAPLPQAMLWPRALDWERRARILRNEEKAVRLIREAIKWCVDSYFQMLKRKPLPRDTVLLETEVMPLLRAMRELHVRMNDQESAEMIQNHTMAYFDVMRQRLIHAVSKPRLYRQFEYKNYTRIVATKSLDAGQNAAIVVDSRRIVLELYTFFDRRLARALFAVTRDDPRRAIELHPLAFKAFEILCASIAECNGQRRNDYQLYHYMLEALRRDQMIPGTGLPDDFQPLPQLWKYMHDMTAYAATSINNAAKG